MFDTAAEAGPEPVDAAGLNTGECPQESEKKSKKARKFDDDPIK